MTAVRLFWMGRNGRDVLMQYPEVERFVRPYLGSEQMIQGKPRWCLWIEDEDVPYAQQHPYLKTVLDKVRAFV